MFSKRQLGTLASCQPRTQGIVGKRSHQPHQEGANDGWGISSRKLFFYSSGPNIRGGRTSSLSNACLLLPVTSP
jgi:hypothetical protein